MCINVLYGYAQQVKSEGKYFIPIFIYNFVFPAQCISSGTNPAIELHVWRVNPMCLVIFVENDYEFLEDSCGML